MIKFGPVTINEATGNDIEHCIAIINDWGDAYDFHGCKDAVEATRYLNTRESVLVADDQGVGPCGFAYIDYLVEPFYATVGICKKKGYANPRTVAAIVKQALPYWFSVFDIEKLLCWTRHRSAIALARALGFTIEGTSRHHTMIDGEWVDMTQMSILKEEAWENRETSALKVMTRASFTR